ncbi:MAG: hypothetical protein ACRDGV_08160 [Candidatus Limnocylindria bacterium]
MVRIRRFGVVRTANLAAVLYFLVSLLFVLPFVLILFATGGGSAAPGVPGAPGVPDLRAFGLVFALLIPLLYAGLGWIFTAIACLFYNLAARFTGGIEVEVTREQVPQAPMP